MTSPSDQRDHARFGLVADQPGYGPAARQQRDGSDAGGRAGDQDNDNTLQELPATQPGPCVAAGEYYDAAGGQSLVPPS